MSDQLLVSDNGLEQQLPLLTKPNGVDFIQTYHSLPKS